MRENLFEKGYTFAKSKDNSRSYRIKDLEAQLERERKTDSKARYRENTRYFEDPEVSRRRFLKIGFGLMGLAVASGTAYKSAEKLTEENGLIQKIMDRMCSFRIRAEAEPAKKEIPVANAQTETIEYEEEFNQDDVSSVEKILNFDNQKIELNSRAYDALENNWKKIHSKGERLHSGFHKAFHEMGAWMPQLTQIFRGEGFKDDLQFTANGKQISCSKFIFLAIPESYWRIQARSTAGANGPYQFIQSTGRRHNLKINNEVDERLDPLESARACAKELRYLIKKTGDEDLALSGYNGGFIWEYLTKARIQERPNYPGFMKFLEKKVNNLLENTKNGKYIEHTIKRGENIFTIAKNYGIKVDEIYKFNNIRRNSKISSDLSIRIPLHQDNREKVFNYRIRGFSENLNYPAKFNAIIKLIKEGAVTEMRGSIKYREVPIKPVRQNETYHSVKKGENIYMIARQYKCHPKIILKANPKILPADIRKTRLNPGMALKIPVNKVKSPSLASIAKDHHMSVKEIHDLNPSILNIYNPIPNNIKTIRINAYG